MPMLNDVQSRLNATEMLRVAHPSNVEEVRAAVNDAALRGEPVCPAGSLHSMGGQQFAGGGISLSSSSLTAIGPLQRDPIGPVRDCSGAGRRDLADAGPGPVVARRRWRR